MTNFVVTAFDDVVKFFEGAAQGRARRRHQHQPGPDRGDQRQDGDRERHPRPGRRRGQCGAGARAGRLPPGARGRPDHLPGDPEAGGPTCRRSRPRPGSSTPRPAQSGPSPDVRLRFIGRRRTTTRSARPSAVASRTGPGSRPRACTPTTSSAGRQSDLRGGAGSRAWPEAPRLRRQARQPAPEAPPATSTPPPRPEQCPPSGPRSRRRCACSRPSRLATTRRWTSSPSASRRRRRCCWRSTRREGRCSTSTSPAAVLERDGADLRHDLPRRKPAAADPGRLDRDRGPCPTASRSSAPTTPTTMALRHPRAGLRRSDRPAAADGVYWRAPRDGARIEIVGTTQALYFYRDDTNAWARCLA